MKHLNVICVNHPSDMKASSNCISVSAMTLNHMATPVDSVKGNLKQSLNGLAMSCYTQGGNITSVLNVTVSFWRLQVLLAISKESGKQVPAQV